MGLSEDHLQFGHKAGHLAPPVCGPITSHVPAPIRVMELPDAEMPDELTCSAQAQTWRPLARAGNVPRLVEGPRPGVAQGWAPQVEVNVLAQALAP